MNEAKKIKLSLFEEERKIPCISAILRNRGFVNITNEYWYSTWETNRDDITYSSIELLNDNNTLLFQNGLRVLLIGINPRSTGDNQSYRDEISEYLESKKKNPEIRHRQGCEDCLEPTRRNAILDSLSSEEGISRGVKELITIDLFSRRTHTSTELKDLIEGTENIENIIGRNNQKILKETIGKADMIIIAWGGDINSTFWGMVSQYRDNLYNWLSDSISKCKWYGATGNGSPRHIAYRNANSFQNLNSEQLADIFGL